MVTNPPSDLPCLIPGHAFPDCGEALTGSGIVQFTVGYTIAPAPFGDVYYIKDAVFTFAPAPALEPSTLALVITLFFGIAGYRGRKKLMREIASRVQI
jgi:hypothetical protein